MSQMVIITALRLLLLSTTVSSISLSWQFLNESAYSNTIEPVSYTHLTLPTICSV